MRRLGRSGVTVSRLCFGTMTFGSQWQHIGTTSQRDADALVSRCLEAGINFFDTADVYSSGEAEESLGRALGTRRRDVILATKVRGRMADDPNAVGLTRHHILNAVDASLRRLGTDWIDLYQVHCWDAATPIEETLRALDDCVRWGKVRYVGASNFAAWQLMKSLAVAERHGLERFVTLQPLYNLVQRDVETEIVPLCQDQDIGILPWSPLAGGFLSGKFRRGTTPPPESRRSRAEKPFLVFDEVRGYEAIEALEEIAAAHEATVAQAALNWLLAKPWVTSVIFGARTLDQLDDDLGAVRWEMSAAEVARLDAILPPARLYPRWFLDMFNAER